MSGASVVAAVLVGVWAVAGVALRRYRPGDPIGHLVIALAVAGGLVAGVVAAAGGEHALARVGVFLGPAAVLHLGLAFPDGPLRSPSRRAATAFGWVAAGAVGLMSSATSGLPVTWWVMLLVAVGWGAAGTAIRYRHGSALDRRRVRWLAWGVAVAAVTPGALAALHLIGAALSPALSALCTVAIPAALVASCRPSLLDRIDELLFHTIRLVGVAVVALAIQLLFSAGWPDKGARAATGSEPLRSFLGLLAGALLTLATWTWLGRAARSLLRGRRPPPEELLRIFAARAARDLPLDELLLQVAESLRSHLPSEHIEIWTGSDGRFARTVSLPHRPVIALAADRAALEVLARTSVTGNGWAEVWWPSLLADRGDGVMRLAPAVHAGEVLGVVVVQRDPGSDPFTEESDRLLADLAPQLGLTLYNVRLDAALRQSLEDLRRHAEELQESRARIVSAGDAERRRIERDLHDGAQQRLVALAVKLSLAREVCSSEPVRAGTVLSELQSDVQQAVQELRSLAHGIYPPLLESSGLGAALAAAAARAGLSTEVEMSAVGRHRPEAEAAVYFCCLEALQNAAKHAGDGAEAVVRVETDGEWLRFEVRDNGQGFHDPGSAEGGRGLTNMADRVGALGGSFQVHSSPGEGTTIVGLIPISD